MSAREFDLVLHGATGFVGALAATHLAAHAPADLRIALSGRNLKRLEAARDHLRRDLPLVVTDSTDNASVQSLAESARVVISTVGPYARYGLPLVLACARAGTTYADLTGEVLFAAQSVHQAHDVAQSTGARIVHSCGFDSVPSDIGTFELFQRVGIDGQGTLGDTVFELVTIRGGISGGTVDSMRTMIDDLRADPARRRVAFDPFALSPDRAADPDGRADRDVMMPTRDPLLGRWVAPFVMSSYNTRIVRRSNALLDHAYGPQFHYREVMNVGDSLASPIVAGAVAAGMGAFAGGLAFGPTRRLLDRFLPKPGSGPAQKTRENGCFVVRIHTCTTTGARYVATFSAPGDPGYGATAVMLGQSALSLATDPLSSPLGVLTPAVAMGSNLTDRLRSQGWTIDVTRV